jgi:hypothetical protein
VGLQQPIDTGHRAQCGHHDLPLRSFRQAHPEVRQVTVTYNYPYTNENMVTDSVGNSSDVFLGNIAQRFYIASTTGEGCTSCGYSMAQPPSTEPATPTTTQAIA